MIEIWTETEQLLVNAWYRQVLQELKGGGLNWEDGGIEMDVLSNMHMRTYRQCLVQHEIGGKCGDTTRHAMWTRRGRRDRRGGGGGAGGERRMWDVSWGRGRHWTAGWLDGLSRRWERMSGAVFLSLFVSSCPSCPSCR